VKVELMDMGLQLVPDENGDRFSAYVVIGTLDCEKCGERGSFKDSVDQQLVRMTTEGPAGAMVTSTVNTAVNAALMHRCSWWMLLKRWWLKMLKRFNSKS
jgi:hypothetical protein